MAVLSSYTPISTQTLSSGSTEITFNSFSGYTDLVLVCNVFGTANYSGFIRFNGDTGSNYSTTMMQGNGTSATSSRASSQTSINVLSKPIGFDTTYPTNGIINIQNYSNSTTYKTVLSRTNVVRASVGETAAYVGTWRNTAEITSFTIISDGGTYASGSTFSLYGIANNTAGAKATGGVISSDSSYFYHSFYATDTFTPTQSLTCDYLVVAGGGGGGRGFGGGGGGGAGGYKTSIGGSPLSVTAQAYTITVGAGGTGGPDSATAGGSGGNSVFSSVTSTGGGGGGTYPSVVGNAGGSGGGGGGGDYNSGTATAGGAASPAGQGNAGGAGFNSGATYGAGGGGGAGAAGTASSQTVGGNGGIGLSNSITGIATYYAGGGGGVGQTQTTAGTGGLGGGANAGLVQPTGGKGFNGSVGTGGGGGGGSTSPNIGGAGGSGVVIIRYAR